MLTSVKFCLWWLDTLAGRRRFVYANDIEALLRLANVLIMSDGAAAEVEVRYVTGELVSSDKLDEELEP